MYDLYTNEISTLKIWNALEFKYKAGEASTKKFLISKYIEYTFNDEIPILSQVHELQVLVNQLKAAEIELPEFFQVGAIIAKLPPSWKSYRKKLLHDTKDYSLEELQKHLRIEEESKVTDGKENTFVGIDKANSVNKSLNKSNKGKQTKENFLGPKKNIGNFKKPMKGGCFVCGKFGHYARECRFKKDKKSEVNSIVQNEDIVATISEICAIQGKISGWWYDTCAAIHVCYDKSLFKTYKKINDGQEI